MNKKILDFIKSPSVQSLTFVFLIFCALAHFLNDPALYIVWAGLVVIADALAYRSGLTDGRKGL